MSDANHLIEKLAPELVQSRVAAKRSMKQGREAVARVAAGLANLKIEYVPVGDVRANTYNPNRQSERDFELLLKSIEEDGFTQPILVAQDGTIVDGEHRWRAAMALGYTEIPVVRMDMDAARARVATIRHNRARGTHDLDLEAQILRDFERLGATHLLTDSLMMSDDEMARLAEDFSAATDRAGEEFSPGWVPTAEPAGVEAAINNDGISTGGTSGEVALTEEALRAKRELEEKLLGVTDEDQIREIRKADDTFTFRVRFSSEQRPVVTRVLGEKPAERLLALLSRFAERG